MKKIPKFLSKIQEKESEKSTMGTKEKITCVCYNTEQVFTSRQKAINYFNKAIAFSEGSEQNRYCNILSKLLDGAIYCTDED